MKLVNLTPHDVVLHVAGGVACGFEAERKCAAASRWGTLGA